MRLAPVLFLAGLIGSSATAVLAQPDRDACSMLDPSVLESSLGADPEVVEQSGAGTGISLCYWTGGDGVGIRLHSITAVAQNIAGGTPLQYFEQNQANEIENLTPANVSVIEGPWQAGHIVDVTTEPNPQQFYSISFINKDDTVTLETFGLPKETTISLAEAVAQSM